MGTLTLRTALGIATLACAVGAQAQLNPAVRQATGPLVQPIKTQRNWTDVELRDRAGNVVILSYTDGRDGARLIKFVDGEGRLIMGLPARPAMVPSSTGGTQNPLAGDPLPPLGEPDWRQLGAGRGGGSDSDGKSDMGSDIATLKKNVDTLWAYVEDLRQRLNARPKNK